MLMKKCESKFEEMDDRQLKKTVESIYSDFVQASQSYDNFIDQFHGDDSFFIESEKILRNMNKSIMEMYRSFQKRFKW